MFRFTRFTVSFVVVLLFSHTSLAAGVAEEKEKLTAIQQSVAQQRAHLAEMEAELATYPKKLAAVEEELREAEQELATGQQELAKLQAAATTPELERQIALREHALQMSKRRVRSETRMLERFSRYRDDLQGDIADAKSTIAQLEQNAVEQRRRANAAEPQTNAIADAVSSTSPPPPAVTPPPEPEVSVAAPAQPKPATHPVENQVPTLSDQDYQAVQIVKATMERVSRVTEGANGQPRYSNLQLTGNNIEPVTFNHIGADQYRAEATLSHGRHRFRIDSLRFQTDISADNAGENYVFIVDARDRAQLKATYFKASLLNYIGRNPVPATGS